MLFERAVPPGPAVSPESVYTGLDLAARAPAGRPYVVCNFVSSADGKATAEGRSAKLGGEGDREVFHLLRTQADAVLAGTGTLAVERYGVMTKNERLAGIRVAEGRAEQPLAVVISRSGQIPFEIPMFADARQRVALYTPSGAHPGLAECAAEVIHHELCEGKLAGVLRSLREDHGVRSLMCEGGPVLFDAMLAEDLVDELFLTLAPALVGGSEASVTAGPGMAKLQALRLVWALEHDGNLFLRYARR